MNTRGFVHQVQGIQLQPNECISSYDVSALFVSVPLDPTITIKRRKLEQDQELHLRTSMSVVQISPIVVNLFMEDFETKDFSTAEHPPRIWKRYVDYTFVVIQSSKKEKFLEHMNNMNPHIHFTTENAKADGLSPSWIP